MPSIHFTSPYGHVKPPLLQALSLKRKKSHVAAATAATAAAVLKVFSGSRGKNVLLRQGVKYRNMFHTGNGLLRERRPGEEVTPEKGWVTDEESDQSDSEGGEEVTPVFLEEEAVVEKIEEHEAEEEPEMLVAVIRSESSMDLIHEEEEATKNDLLKLELSLTEKTMPEVVVSEETMAEAKVEVAEVQVVPIEEIVIVKGVEQQAPEEVQVANVEEAMPEQIVVQVVEQSEVAPAEEVTSCSEEKIPDIVALVPEPQPDLILEPSAPKPLALTSFMGILEPSVSKPVTLTAVMSVLEPSVPKPVASMTPFEVPQAETVPKVKEAEPEVKETLSEVEEALPEVKETEHEVKETLPEVEGAAPEVEEAVSEVEETVVSQVETATEVKETAVSEVEETAPEVEETAPEVEETAPEVEETAPEVEETEVTIAAALVEATEEEIHQETQQVLPELKEADVLLSDDIQEPLEVDKMEHDSTTNPIKRDVMVEVESQAVVQATAPACQLNPAESEPGPLPEPTVQAQCRELENDVDAKILPLPVLIVSPQPPQQETPVLAISEKHSEQLFDDECCEYIDTELNEIEEPEGEVEYEHQTLEGRLESTPSQTLKLILPLPSSKNGPVQSTVALCVKPEQSLSDLQELIRHEISQTSTGPQHVTFTTIGNEPPDMTDTVAKTGTTGFAIKESEHTILRKSSYTDPINTTRWSLSTEIGTFVGDAARGQAFTIDVSPSPDKPPSTTIRVSLPTFHDRTSHLRSQLRSLTPTLSSLSTIKSDCDAAAQRTAQRQSILKLATTGFVCLLLPLLLIAFAYLSQPGLLPSFRNPPPWDLKLTHPVTTYLAAGIGDILLLAGFAYLWTAYRNAGRPEPDLATLQKVYSERGFQVQKWEELQQENKILRSEIRRMAAEYGVTWDEAEIEETKETGTAATAA